MNAEDQRERYIGQQFQSIEDRMEAGDKRMSDVESRLTAALVELKRNSEITEDIREILTAGKLGLRVLGAVGQAVRWLGLVAAGAAALYGAYQALRGNVPPKP
jgi:hypothetical protein